MNESGGINTVPNLIKLFTYYIKMMKYSADFKEMICMFIYIKMMMKYSAYYNKIICFILKR